MDSREEQQRKKREDRRKRRVRNQILSYSVMGILILGLAVGIVFGVNSLLAGNRDARQEQQDEQQEKQDMIEEMLSEEEEVITTPEPEPSPEPSPEPTARERLDEIVNAGIDAMPLEDKVAGLFIVTPESITGVSTVIQAGEGTQQALTQHPVGGLIYFKDNIQSEEQLRTMLENTRQYANYPVFLAVDEEGGSVARVASAGIGPVTDSAGDIGATGDPQNAYNAGITIGSTLAGLGFNVDFAPVADLANVEGSFMEGRSYGADAENVSNFVVSMVKGLEDQNVTACLKHFPGIGSTEQDPHNGMSTTDRTVKQSRTTACSRAAVRSGAVNRSRARIRRSGRKRN